MEVEGRERRRPGERRRRYQRGRLQARPPAGAPRLRAEAAGTEDDRQHGDERELEGYLERRARPREREHQGRQRQAPEHVRPPARKASQYGGHDHDGGAQRRDPEARQGRVQRDRGETRDGGHALDVDGQDEPLAAAQKPAEHREARCRHQAHVQAGDREDVYHAGAAERVAQLGVDLALLAHDERLQHGPRGNGNRGADRRREPRTPTLEPAAEAVAGRWETLDRLLAPDERRHLDAAAREVRHVVEAAGVLEVARRTQDGVGPEAIAVPPAAGPAANTDAHEPAR